MSQQRDRRGSWFSAVLLFAVWLPEIGRAVPFAAHTRTGVFPFRSISGG